MEEKSKFQIVDIDGEQEAIPTKEYLQQKEEARLKELFHWSEIPEEYWQYSLSIYRGTKSIKSLEAVRKYISHIDDPKYDGTGLYIWGPNANQKTMIACEILKSFVAAGKKAKFILSDKLVDLLIKSQGYSTTEEHQRKFEELDHCDIICVDDIFDPEKHVEWKNNDLVTSALDGFFRKKLYDKCKFILTSNQPFAMVQNLFGVSIRSLIERHIWPLEFLDSVKELRTQRLEKLFRS